VIAPMLYDMTMRSSEFAMIFGKGVTSIYNGDCRDVLPTLDLVDAVVTDPPYGLSFMGKGWDRGIPGVEFWEAVMGAMKPGAHLLAFGGTRTFHRLTCAIEDAGFEIRDCLMWVYGSGFPKSLDVGKAIDKLDAVDMRRTRNLKFTAWMRSTGITAKQVDDITQTFMGSHFTTHPTQPAIPTADLWAKLRPHIVKKIPQWVEVLVEQRTIESRSFAEREVIGQQARKNDRDATSIKLGRKSDIFDITVSNTDAAKEWEGWGTSLKPAWEPIILARKPLEGTVANNVLEHGVGGLNIEGCRVGNDRGRWPANLIHDGSDEVVELFPDTAPSKDTPRNNNEFKSQSRGGGKEAANVTHGHNDSGSAARFFYKAGYDDTELILNSAKTIISSWKRDLANIVVDYSSPSSSHAAFALNHAVTVASQGAKRLSDIQGLFMSATQSGLESLGERLIEAILCTERSVLPDQLHGELFPSSDLVQFVETPNQTDTMTITISLERSDGYAGGVTFNIMSTNSVVGEKDLRKSRLIYCAKASKKDRGEGNNHPTVKNTKLMQYLCRLITPPGGVVLDPFMGSGSTLVAAQAEGFNSVGIDTEESYCEIARRRCASIATEEWIGR